MLIYTLRDYVPFVLKLWLWSSFWLWSEFHSLSLPSSCSPSLSLPLFNDIHNCYSSMPFHINLYDPLLFLTNCAVFQTMMNDIITCQSCGISSWLPFPDPLHLSDIQFQSILPPSDFLKSFLIFILCLSPKFSLYSSFP